MASCGRLRKKWNFWTCENLATEKSRWRRCAGWSRNITVMSMDSGRISHRWSRIKTVTLPASKPWKCELCLTLTLTVTLIQGELIVIFLRWCHPLCDGGLLLYSFLYGYCKIKSLHSGCFYNNIPKYEPWTSFSSLSFSSWVRRSSRSPLVKWLTTSSASSGVEIAGNIW